MSEEQTESVKKTEEEKVPGVGEETRPKKGGRNFVTLITLILATAPAILAYLKDGDFFRELLAKDAWMSQLIGNCHPVLMLIPVGLVLFVVLLEIFGWLSFGKWKPVTVFALFLVVISSTLAALTGLVLMQLEGNAGADWTRYMWYGIGAAGALALSFIFKIWGENGNGRGFFYALLLLGGATLLGYGGYTYGQKVHGYTFIPSSKDPESPFLNQKMMEGMRSQISQLEVAGEEMKTELSQKKVELSQKGQELIQLSAAQKRTEDNLRGEQQKRAAAEKSTAELQKKLTAVQAKASSAEKKAAATEKKAAEVRQKLTLANKKLAEAEKKMGKAKEMAAQKLKQEQKLQQELKDLKAETKALKESAEASEKQPEKEDEKKDVEEKTE